MSSFQQWFYPEQRFGGFTDVDGTVRFYHRVNALVEPDFVVVDVGCGRGSYLEDPTVYRRNLQLLKGKCRRVIGIDVDPEAAGNPGLDEFRLIEGDRWPLDTASADLLVSDFVLEHVPDPPTFFAECSRVLRPGGYFCARTVNAWGYESIAARLIPERFHARVLRRVQPGRQGEDVFPKLYRCNRLRRLRALLGQHGLQGAVYTCFAEPAYLGFSRALYALGVLYHRFAPPMLRGNIFVFVQKAP